MPNPDAVLERLLGWCSISAIHADRLDRSWDRLRTARTHTSFYAGWIEQGRPAEWASTVREYNERLTWGKVWTFNADVQAFLNSAAQVAKCVRLLGAEGYPAAPDGTPVRTARNYEEHWEDPSDWTREGVSATWGAFDHEPGMIVELGHALWVGGASMNALSDWINQVQSVAAEQARATGHEVPTARTHVYRVTRRERP